jgi:hypothetical protein
MRAVEAQRDALAQKVLLAGTERLELHEANRNAREYREQAERARKMAADLNLWVPFTLGPQAIISDPCYARGTWCAGTVKVKPGLWVGAVKYKDCGDGWGTRVSGLYAWHVETAIPDGVGPADDPLPIDVGVDSGQAGIFCESLYPQTEDQKGESDEPDTFYGAACASSNAPLMFGGVQGRGIVSMSGLGDGGYTAYAQWEGDQAVVLRIDFGLDGDDEEDEADDDGGDHGRSDDNYDSYAS